jgi:hypothetical protein
MPRSSAAGFFTLSLRRINGNYLAHPGSVLILVSEVEPAKRNGVPYAAGNNYKDTATF